LFSTVILWVKQPHTVSQRRRGESESQYTLEIDSWKQHIHLNPHQITIPSLFVFIPTHACVSIRTPFAHTRTNYLFFLLIKPPLTVPIALLSSFVSVWKKGLMILHSTHTFLPPFCLFWFFLPFSLASLLSPGHVVPFNS